jgi:3-hydroxyacyl-[acyl-carrier-protein] dehydratase
MTLYNNFYTASSPAKTENGCEYSILLNKEHFIYQAHFPGNPITPGVCIVQICTELMENYTECKLQLKRINNVKFISVINPELNGSLRIAFSKISEIADGYTFAALVYNESAQFSKLSLEVSVLS